MLQSVLQDEVLGGEDRRSCSVGRRAALVLRQDIEYLDRVKGRRKEKHNDESRLDEAAREGEREKCTNNLRRGRVREAVEGMTRGERERITEKGK